MKSITRVARLIFPPACLDLKRYSAIGEEKQKYFAWLPSVPQGTVSVDLNIGGKTEHLEGVGYHDHNWGDAPMMKLINHWYWGRAQLGPYTVIACLVTAAERYGLAAFPIFLLAKDGQVIADDDAFQI